MDKPQVTSNTQFKVITQSISPLVQLISITFNQKEYTIKVSRCSVKDSPATQCNMRGQKIDHVFRLVSITPKQIPSESKQDNKKKEYKKHKWWKASMIYDSKDYDSKILEKGVFTLKADGRNAAIINGKLYLRQELRQKKDGTYPEVPNSWIPCQKEPKNGHFPCYRPAEKSDKWEQYAFEKLKGLSLVDGAYEIVGAKFQKNPDEFKDKAYLSPHATVIFDIPQELRCYEGIKKLLENLHIEGFVVYDLENKIAKKIRRDGFGFEWPQKGRSTEIKPDILESPHIKN